MLFCTLNEEFEVVDLPDEPEDNRSFVHYSEKTGKTIAYHRLDRGFLRGIGESLSARSTKAKLAVIRIERAIERFRPDDFGPTEADWRAKLSEAQRDVALVEHAITLFQNMKQFWIEAGRPHGECMDPPEFPDPWVVNLVGTWDTPKVEAVTMEPAQGTKQ